MSFEYEIMDEMDVLYLEMYRGAVISAEAKLFEKELKGKNGFVDYETKFDGFHTYCLKQDGNAKYPTVRIPLNNL